MYDTDRTLGITITELAQRYLENYARNNLSPIYFHIKGNHKNGEFFDQCLKAPSLYTLPWGWPSLDLQASADYLDAVLAVLDTGSGFETLVLTAHRAGQASEVVCDLLGKIPEPPARPDADPPLRIANLDKVLADIGDTELIPGAGIAVVSLDMSYSKEYELSGHMMYALDGTSDILWTGSCAKSLDRQGLLDAAKREIAETGRSEMVFVVSGVIADLGDGRARLKSPHRIAVLELD